MGPVEKLVLIVVEPFPSARTGLVESKAPVLTVCVPEVKIVVDPALTGDIITGPLMRSAARRNCVPTSPPMVTAPFGVLRRSVVTPFAVPSTLPLNVMLPVFAMTVVVAAAKIEWIGLCTLRSATFTVATLAPKKAVPAFKRRRLPNWLVTPISSTNEIVPDAADNWRLPVPGASSVLPNVMPEVPMILSVPVVAYVTAGVKLTAVAEIVPTEEPKTTELPNGTLRVPSAVVAPIFWLNVTVLVAFNVKFCAPLIVPVKVIMSALLIVVEPVPCNTVGIELPITQALTSAI